MGALLVVVFQVWVRCCGEAHRAGEKSWALGPERPPPFISGRPSAFYFYLENEGPDAD